MTTPYYIDKLRCWFGFDQDGTVHCYHNGHRLCDSKEATEKTKSVVTTDQRPTCGKCLERLNTAIHDTRPARDHSP